MYTKALQDFPEDAYIAGIAVSLAKTANKPLEEPLIRAIKAEYTHLSAASVGVAFARPRADTLRAYFMELAKVRAEALQSPRRARQTRSDDCCDGRISAMSPAQHPEEALDIRIRAHVAVAIEVRAPARGTARPGQAREERLDIRIRAQVPVPVEVRGVDINPGRVRG